MQVLRDDLHEVREDAGATLAGVTTAWHIAVLVTSLLPMLLMTYLALPHGGVRPGPGRLDGTHRDLDRADPGHLSSERSAGLSRGQARKRATCADGIAVGELSAIAGAPKVVRAPSGLVKQCGPLTLRVFPPEGVVVEKARAGRWRLLVPKVGQYFYRFDSPIDDLDGHNLYVYDSPLMRQAQRLVTRVGRRAIVTVERRGDAIDSGATGRLKIGVTVPPLKLVKGLSGLLEISVCTDMSHATLTSSRCQTQLVDIGSGDRIARSFAYQAGTSGTVRASVEVLVRDPQREGVSASKVAVSQDVSSIDVSLWQRIKSTVKAMDGTVTALFSMLAAVLAFWTAWHVLRQARRPE